MKIAIIGPTHPYKGGIAQHTTQLAHHLAAAGHEVQIISWREQYPFFYPGEQFVPDGKPEMPVFPDTKRVLSWRNPAGWLVWGRKLVQFDEVIFVWWLPIIQGPIYMSMLRALGKHGPRKVFISHNIVSHNVGPADRQLTRQVFKLVDRIIVHTAEMSEQARLLTKTPVSLATMPSHLPGQPCVQPKQGKLQKSLLFFGLVRQYKGVDILLRALAGIPEVRLTIAGEMWGRQETSLRQLIAELKLDDRVKLLSGYVPVEAIAPLFANSDCLVMPYRSGTASQMSQLAFAYGRPVIATKVGSMPKQIRDGIDGLLCEPNDVASLSDAIKHFYAVGVADSLTANIPHISAQQDWQNYIETITSAK